MFLCFLFAHEIHETNEKSKKFYFLFRIIRVFRGRKINSIFQINFKPSAVSNEVDKCLR